MHNLNDILNESYKLEEGAKFGEKEINDILSRSGDFNIGIEYEFNIGSDNEYDRSDVENILTNGFGIEHIDKVIPEHDSMLEVITEKMNLKDAINNIKGMFKFLDSDMAKVNNFAGMHVSISTNKYDLDDFNKSKFMVLLNSEYIHKIFPQRRHVQNFNDTIKNAITKFKKYNKSRSFDKEAVSIVEDIIEETLDSKYITATMKDYNMMGGRIELRFFGGQDYHQMYDDIKQQILRSLFIMEIAYTDLYQKEYYKSLYKFIKNDDEVEIPAQVEKELKLAINRKDAKKVDNILFSMNDSFDKHQAFFSLPSRMQTKIKNIFKDDAETAMTFAEDVLNGKFEEGEPAIAQNAEYSYYYAMLTRERFGEGEEKIFSELSMDKIEHYVNVTTQYNNYDKQEIIQMMVNMPTDIMEDFIATVMDNYGEELTQEMGQKIFAQSSRAAEFAVKYLLNDSDVRNAKTTAFTLNNEYLKTHETSLIDEDRILERVRKEKSPSLIEDLVSNVRLSDEQSIEIIDKVYDIFKNIGLGIDDDGNVDRRVAKMISDTIANKSPTVKEYFENKIGLMMWE